MSSANFMRVVEGSERCINGHKVVDKRLTPWRCDEPTCEYFNQPEKTEAEERKLIIMDEVAYVDSSEFKEMRPVSSTIQQSEPVSENSLNDTPDPVEQLYIDSSAIGLVEFRKRVESFGDQRELATLERLFPDLSEANTFSYYQVDADEIKSLRAAIKKKLGE